MPIPMFLLDQEIRVSVNGRFDDSFFDPRRVDVKLEVPSPSRGLCSYEFHLSWEEAKKLADDIYSLGPPGSPPSSASAEPTPPDALTLALESGLARINGEGGVEKARKPKKPKSKRLRKHRRPWEEA